MLMFFIKSALKITFKNIDSHRNIKENIDVMEET